MLMQILEERYNIQRNQENDKIKIVPLNEYAFRCRIGENESYIEITNDEFLGLLLRIYKFNNSLNEVVLRTYEAEEDEEELEE